nr:hypothetical protein [Tanacetum cinerariifolium]
MLLMILQEQMAEEEWDRKMNYYHPSNWTQEEESFDHEPYNRNVNTLDANVIHVEQLKMVPIMFNGQITVVVPFDTFYSIKGCCYWYLLWLVKREEFNAEEMPDVKSLDIRNML